MRWTLQSKSRVLRIRAPRGLEIRAKFAALPNAGTDAQELAERVTNIQKEMERLGARKTDIGLKARDDIEEFSFKSGLLLLASIAQVRGSLPPWRACRRG